MCFMAIMILKKTLNVSCKIHVAINSISLAILYIHFSVSKPIYIHNHHHYPKHQFKKKSTTGKNNTQRLSTVSGPDFNKALHLARCPPGHPVWRMKATHTQCGCRSDVTPAAGLPVEPSWAHLCRASHPPTSFSPHTLISVRVSLSH